MADSLIVKLGADTSDFRGEISRAASAAKSGIGEIESATSHSQAPLKELQRGFRELKELFVAGGGLHLALNWFESLAERAEKSKDLTDANIDSTRRWGEEFAELKNGVAELGTQVLGFLANAGRGLGDLFKILSSGAKSLFSGDGFVAGMAKAVVEIKAANSAEAETRKQMLETTKAIKEANDHRKTTLDIQRKQQEAEREQMKILKERAEEDDKRRSALEKLAGIEHQSALAKLNDQNRLLQLNKDLLEVQSKINSYVQFQRQGGQLTSEGVNELITLKESQKEIEKDIADTTERKANAEKKTTNELKTQLGLLAGIRGGSQFNDASDEALKEISRKNRNEAARLKGGIGLNADIGSILSGGIGPNIEIARLLAEAVNAEKELETRNRYRSLLELPGGMNLARQSFSGDPLSFESFISQIQNKSGTQIDKTQTRIATGIEELNTRLRVAGFGTGG